MGPYTLALKFVQGEQVKYEMNQTLSAQVNVGGTNSITQINQISVVQTVETVNADGSATLLTNPTYKSETENGKPQLSLLSTGSNTETISAAGRISGISGLAPESQFPGPNFPNTYGIQFDLPTTPVSIGDKWTVTEPIPDMGLIMKSTLTLVSVTSSNVAFVKGVMSSTPMDLSAAQKAALKASGSFSGSSNMQFDITNGQVVASQIDILADLTFVQPGQSGKPPSSNRVQEEFRTQMTADPGPK
jgi:hypothetical protein